MSNRAERIRIALLGNMNNNHFALAQYLRMHGYDCMLLLFDCDQDHFLPSCDTYDTSYMSWTKTLSWGSSRGFMGTSSSIISADLSDYDVIIGCGLSPAFCNKAGINLDVMVPYGSDIWLETMFRLVSLHTLPSVWLSVLMQRIGLGKVKVLHSSITNKTYEKQIRRYTWQAKRWYEGVPMVFAPNYEKNEDLINKTHWGFEFLRIRKSCELMVIAHGRHVWSDPSNMSSKGNDILLKGWALFCDQTPDIKKQLVLLEYGKDVLKSKQYVKDLGIEESVTWLPKMYRKDIMAGLFMADMVAAEFVHSWMTGGVLYEALVARKPILTYRDDAVYLKDYPCLYPIYNANSPETIRSRLEEYVANPEAGKKIGLIGRKWYEEEVVNKALDKYSHYIDRRASKLGKLARH